MAETFPSAPRASVAVRLTAVLIGLAGLALAIRVTLPSLEWIGTPFPGFVLLTNRVVASIGLRDWSGAAVEPTLLWQVCGA